MEEVFHPPTDVHGLNRHVIITSCLITLCAMAHGQRVALWFPGDYRVHGAEALAASGGVLCSVP